jgi:hypothetical protein
LLAEEAIWMFCPSLLNEWLSLPNFKSFFYIFFDLLGKLISQKRWFFISESKEGGRGMQDWWPV